MVLGVTPLSRSNSGVVTHPLATTEMHKTKKAIRPADPRRREQSMAPNPTQTSSAYAIGQAAQSGCNFVTELRIRGRWAALRQRPRRVPGGQDVRVRRAIVDHVDHEFLHRYRWPRLAVEATHRVAAHISRAYFAVNYRVRAHLAVSFVAKRATGAVAQRQSSRDLPRPWSCTTAAVEAAALVPHRRSLTRMTGTRARAAPRSRRRFRWRRGRVADRVRPLSIQHVAFE